MIQFFFSEAVWLLFKALASVAVAPQVLRDALSRDWPIASGKIENGEIWAVQGRNKEMFRSRLKYTYEVDGRLWVGMDKQDFNDEQTASDYIESRKGMAAEVKYYPRKPERSLLM
jgi:hypothetical protein